MQQSVAEININELVNRRRNRLSEYDYSQNGSYFLTICVKDMRCILSHIVGDVAPGVPTSEKQCPEVVLTDYGKTVKDIIDRTSEVYQNITIEKYVIMPNHIHILLSVYDDKGGTPRASSPTNGIIPVFVTSLKRVSNKEFGFDIWQRSYHDHIIRDDDDFLLRWQYIDENPKKWLIGKDEYYS
jgi:REP element-mobilizing transposase RayT